eukprot:242446_1
MANGYTRLLYFTANLRDDSLNLHPPNALLIQELHQTDRQLIHNQQLERLEPLGLNLSPQYILNPSFHSNAEWHLKCRQQCKVLAPQPFPFVQLEDCWEQNRRRLLHD